MTAVDPIIFALLTGKPTPSQLPAPLACWVERIITCSRGFETRSTSSTRQYSVTAPFAPGGEYAQW
jgi:hypothetical protein